ncbi:MAG: NfeD family protein [Candidatus Accumulibacter sp.]|nr:NfeD family protein [Accumulibacter sp.]
MSDAAFGLPPQWWHWMVLGLCLTLFELFLPSFFILWFGVGAVLLGLVLLVAPGLSLTVQLLLWAAFSLGFTVFWFRYFKNRTVSNVGSSTAHVTGEVGLLTQNLTVDTRGHVRFQKPVLGAEVWECYADEDIETGTRVRIVAVEGNFIKVAKA